MGRPSRPATASSSACRSTRITSTTFRRTVLSLGSSSARVRASLFRFYADNFCDAMGALYDFMTAKGATVVGATSTDGYDHSETKSTRDGKFVGGMPFDELGSSSERMRASLFRFL